MLLYLYSCAFVFFYSGFPTRSELLLFLIKKYWEKEKPGFCETFLFLAEWFSVRPFNLPWGNSSFFFRQNVQIYCENKKF